MTYEIFDKDGKLRIPDAESWAKVKEEVKKAVTVTEVYCPRGHNLIEEDHTIGGGPGIRLGFRRPNGEPGELILSATLGCQDKTVISGKLFEGEKLELFCPVCMSNLPILSECHCEGGGEVRMLYLSRENNPYHAIAFCDVVGCRNSSIIRAGDVVRAARLGEW